MKLISVFSKFVISVFKFSVKAEYISNTPIALFIKCANIEVHKFLENKNKYPNIIPSKNRGKKPKNCICIAEKIKDVIITET